MYFEFDGEPWFIVLDTMFVGSTGSDGIFVPEECEIRRMIVAQFSNFEEMDRFLKEHEETVSAEEKKSFRETMKNKNETVKKKNEAVKKKKLISPHNDTVIYYGKRAYAKFTGFLRTMLNLDEDDLTSSAREQIADLSKFDFMPEKVRIRD